MKTPILLRDNWPALILLTFVLLLISFNNSQAQTDPQHKRTYKCALELPAKPTFAQAEAIRATGDSLRRANWHPLDVVPPNKKSTSTYIIFIKYSR